MTKQQIKLTAPLAVRLPGSARLPKVGDIGTVLASRSESDGRHVLAKFKGRSGPLSLKPDEFVIV